MTVVRTLRARFLRISVGKNCTRGCEDSGCIPKGGAGWQPCWRVSRAKLLFGRPGALLMRRKYGILAVRARCRGQLCLMIMRKGRVGWGNARCGSLPWSGYCLARYNRSGLVSSNRTRMGQDSALYKQEPTPPTRASHTPQRQNWPAPLGAKASQPRRV